MKKLCYMTVYRTTTDPTVYMYTVLSSVTRQPDTPHSDTRQQHLRYTDRHDASGLEDRYYDDVKQKGNVANDVEEEDVTNDVISVINDVGDEVVRDENMNEVRDDVTNDVKDDVSSDVRNEMSDVREDVFQSPANAEAREVDSGEHKESAIERPELRDLRRLSPEFVRVVQSLWPGLQICAGPRCKDDDEYTASHSTTDDVQLASPPGVVDETTSVQLPITAGALQRNADEYGLPAPIRGQQTFPSVSDGTEADEVTGVQPFNRSLPQHTGKDDLPGARVQLQTYAGVFEGTEGTEEDHKDIAHHDTASMTTTPTVNIGAHDVSHDADYDVGLENAYYNAKQTDVVNNVVDNNDGVNHVGDDVRINNVNIDGDVVTQSSSTTSTKTRKSSSLQLQHTSTSLKSTTKKTISSSRDSNNVSVDDHLTSPTTQRRKNARPDETYGDIQRQKTKSDETARHSNAKRQKTKLDETARVLSHLKVTSDQLTAPTQREDTRLGETSDVTHQNTRADETYGDVQRDKTRPHETARGSDIQRKNTRLDETANADSNVTVASETDQNRDESSTTTATSVPRLTTTTSGGIMGLMSGRNNNNKNNARNALPPPGLGQQIVRQPAPPADASGLPDYTSLGSGSPVNSRNRPATRGLEPPLAAVDRSSQALPAAFRPNRFRRPGTAGQNHRSAEKSSQTTAGFASNQRRRQSRVQSGNFRPPGEFFFNRNPTIVRPPRPALPGVDRRRVGTVVHGVGITESQTDAQTLARRRFGGGSTFADVHGNEEPKRHPGHNRTANPDIPDATEKVRNVFILFH